MATKGGIKGVRIPVRLPWKGATDKTEQFVSMKRPVAEWLGLDKLKISEKVYSSVARFGLRFKLGAY